MKTWQTFALAAVALVGAGLATEPVLKPGNRLAIVGDSITEQKQYSRFMETYLLACYPEMNIRCIQLGWGGERAPGFAARMDNDLMPWQPDVVTTCYGMNDGSYRAYTKQIGKTYGDAMKDIVTRLKAAGDIVVVGSPGVVDSYTWSKRRRKQAVSAAVYNDNLAALSKIARELAAANEFPYADVNGAMKSAMVAAKNGLGEEYHVAGADAIHPFPNGHLVMAYAFLKALGFDGDLGGITVDLAADTATAQNGHKVLGGGNGVFEIESSRYIFCFDGDAKNPRGTISILPYVPFNQDLNRFMLKVENLSAAQAEVSFGEFKQTFSKEQLAAGINLAAEFAADNPFADSFNKVMKAVYSKQSQETQMIKGILTNFRSLAKEAAQDKELGDALALVRRKITAKNDVFYNKAKGMVRPIKYKLAVVPK